MEPLRLRSLLVREEATLREVIEAIDRGAVEVALVTDPDDRLIGTVTDGDVRRALLRGMELDDPAGPIVQRQPTTAPLGTSVDVLLDIMRERVIEEIPLMSGDRVVDLAFIRDLVSRRPDDEPVVLMAGGQGLRLRPLTESTPKPMLRVGDRPLLETIVQQVRGAGFQKVFMAVNYRADVIEDHFGDGSAFDVEVEYVQETQQLGSAGALQLLRERLDRPFLLMNADLLTKVSLASLMRFHVDEGNVITVGVRQYRLQVPYGVVDVAGTEVTALREKPAIDWFVNAGVYAASPEAIEFLPDELEVVNMTDIIEAALAAGARVGTFPVREFWLDIGQLSDYERAHEDHVTHFSHLRGQTVDV
jgi:dTDP-glucose pyrophosphorylase